MTFESFLHSFNISANTTFTISEKHLHDKSFSTTDTASLDNSVQFISDTEFIYKIEVNKGENEAFNLMRKLYAQLSENQSDPLMEFLNQVTQEIPKQMMSFTPPFRMLMFSNKASNFSSDILSLFKNLLECLYIKELSTSVLFFIQDSPQVEEILNAIIDTLEIEMGFSDSFYLSPPIKELSMTPMIYHWMSLLLNDKNSNTKSSNGLISIEKCIPKLIINQLGQTKNSLLRLLPLHDNLDLLDAELIKTAETFFKNNLNISDTARALFLHRNTLLYRLDKIQKVTGFDLRLFEDSWLLRLILS